MNNKYAESDTTKADLLNRFQTNLNDENQPLPQFPPAEHNLASIVITTDHVQGFPF